MALNISPSHLCLVLMQKERVKEMEARVEALLNERDVLKGRVQQLKVGLILSQGCSAVFISAGQAFSYLSGGGFCWHSMQFLATAWRL